MKSIIQLCTHRIRVCAIFTFFCLFQLQAQFGILDPTFSGNGIQSTQVLFNGDYCYGMTIQDDGKIITVGQTHTGPSFDFAMVRYNTDGSHDLSFDNDGKVTTPMGITNGAADAQVVMVQPDGKIIVAGYARSQTGVVMHNDFAMARYYENGSLDLTFGTNGKVITDFDTRDDFVYDIDMHADGRIILVGQSKTIMGATGVGMARYLPNGDLDSTFGINGKTFTQIQSLAVAVGVHVTSDDKYIIAANCNFNGFDQFVAAKFLTDGYFDTDFGFGGLNITQIESNDATVNDLKVLSDGKIILAGYYNNGANSDICLVRYNPDGMLDPSFDFDGRVITDIGSTSNTIEGIAIQGDQYIVVSGSHLSTGSNWDLLTARYKMDGSIDSTFGGAGYVIQPVSLYNDFGYECGIQSDGKVVVSGFGDFSNNNDFIIVRYDGCDLPVVTTQPQSQMICEGQNVDFVLTSTGSQSYQWQVNSGSGFTDIVGETDSILSFAAVTTGMNNYIYRCKMANGCSYPLSSSATLTVNSTVAPTTNTIESFCFSGMVSDLNATGTNIQWYDAATGGNLLNATDALVDGHSYFASQTIAGCESLLRSEVLVSIIGTVPAPTGAALQQVCGSGTLADFVVSGSNIQWYDALSGGNLLPIGTALMDGVSYFASQSNNNCESADRLEVMASIVNIPAAPSGNANQDFCGSATLADLVVSGGGIQWYDALSGGNLLPDNTLMLDGQSYFATQTVSACESTDRLEVLATIFAIPAAPTANPEQSFCFSGIVSELIANGSNIQWYDAASGGNLYTGSEALIDGSSYFASQTVGACESNDRLQVTVTLLTSLAAPTGDAVQQICGSGTLADFVVNGTNLQWYENGIGGNLLPLNTVLQVGTTYYASQSNNNCESTDRLGVTPYILTIPPAPSGDPNPSFCDAVALSALPVADDSLTWYDAASGGNVLNESDLFVEGSSYFVSQRENGCESTDRLEIVPTIVHISTVITQQDSVLTADQANASYQWLDCNNSFAILLGETNQSVVIDSTGLYALEITLNGCVDTSNCVNIFLASVEQQVSNDRWKIYPNPSQGLIEIEGIEALDVKHASLMDLSGRTVASWDEINASIDLSFLSSGTYYLILESKSGLVREKIVLEKE